MPWKMCQDSCTAQLNNTPKSVKNPCCTNNSIQSTNDNKMLTKCTSICVQQGCLEIHSLLSLLYGLYSTTHFISQQQKQVFTQKFPWEMCPISLGKCAQLAALSSPSQSSLENLSISSSLVLHTTQCILL
jgi:hypothetical protein